MNLACHGIADLAKSIKSLGLAPIRFEVDGECWDVVEDHGSYVCERESS